MRFPFSLSPLAAAIFVLAGARPLSAEPLNVVVTILPIHSLAASVMEGIGEPRLLVKGAMSEHTYSMRPSDGCEGVTVPSPPRAQRVFISADCRGISACCASR